MEATLQRTGLLPAQRVRGLASLHLSPSLSRRAPQGHSFPSRTRRTAARRGAPLRAFQNGSSASSAAPPPPTSTSSPAPGPTQQTPSIPRPALFRSLSVPSLSAPSPSAPSLRLRLPLSLSAVAFQAPGLPLPDLALRQLAPRDRAVALAGRALISTFSILLLFGGVLSAIHSNATNSLLGAVFLSFTLLATALEPLRRTHSGLADKVLAAVLGYLGFNAISQAVQASPTPLFMVPVYLMLSFVASTAVVFLHPEMYYKKSD